jgi:hypothetical protein
MSQSDFIYHTELLANLPPGYYEEFKQKLETEYPHRKSEFFLDDETKSITQIFAKFHRKEVEGLTEQQIGYYPLCNLEEIELLSNPTDAEDYLLKLRADEVNDHVRTTRTFYKLRQFYGERWNFTDYYHSKLFCQYIFLLPPELEEVCDQVTAGFINEPYANGCCTKTPFGNIILISYALKYFLYYGNLWAIAGSLKINQQDAFDALVISVRIMLGHESMDFEIDSRADLPKEIHERVQKLTDEQLKFIIGHEYAHHYLGHLDNDKLCDFKSLAEVDKHLGELKIYNYSQQNEFEADFYSINNIDRDDDIKGIYLEAATTFFFILDIYRCFNDAMNPAVGNYHTHPKPMDRIWELRGKLPETIGYTTEELNILIERNEELKTFLINDFISIYTDEIETYGSTYIEGFKVEKKSDRLDF